MSGVAVEAILLAAGSSRRFGSDKRLYVLEGQPMLHHALQAWLPAVRQLHVVLRAEDRDRQDALLGPWARDPRLRPLWLPSAGLGMGANLARAVAQLGPDCEGVAIALADMPWIQPATICAVLSAFQPGRVVFPVYQGQQGHPVVFPREWFARLAALQGEQGARPVLQATAAYWWPVPVDDPGVLQDLDHPPR